MFKSLKSKLIAVIALSFMALLILLVSQLVVQLHTMKEEVVRNTQHSMETEVLGRLQSEANGLSNEVSAYFNSLYRASASLTAILEDNAGQANTPLSRDQVNDLIQTTLSSNKDISALYAQFEADGYDGADSAWLGSDNTHTVADTGGFEVYWIRNEAGELEQERITDAKEKYLDEKDEFGQREAEWYLCARDTKAPCTLQPYLYEIRKGYSELMTSLISPIVVNNTFRGVVGIDVNLPVVQALIEKLQASLYDGKSRITLISDMGLIIASSAYQQHQTRPLFEALDTKGGKLTSLHKAANPTWLDNGVYYVAWPVMINASNTTWSILLELPEAVVLASTNALTGTLDTHVVSLLRRQIIIALLATAGALFLSLLLVRSIVEPIQKLDERVHNLASHDGDLSKTIKFQTHSELMSLSSGFNDFILKLRALVIDLKGVAVQAHDTAMNISGINARAAKATADQQREIDSVVTATNEMSVTATNVSELAAEVSSHSHNSLQTVARSRSALQDSVQHVALLTGEMQQAGTIITEVASRAQDINQILDVIRAIAEQTNLLALNAAIEAARAGEQGRGFAVVADEVRNLASKTQNSTDEIHELIRALQDGVKRAVDVIGSSTEKANQTQRDTQASFDSLSLAEVDMNAVAQNIIKVATAAEEQNVVSDDISHNLTIIGDAATQLAAMAQESDHAGAQLKRIMSELDRHLSSLKT